MEDGEDEEDELATDEEWMLFVAIWIAVMQLLG